MGYHSGSMVKIACGLVLAVLFLKPLHTFAQGSISGFYVLIKNKKNCPNRLSSHLGPKMYCLPKEPVITEADFESVGEIKYDKFFQKYFVLRLTANGFKSLKFLTQRLSGSELALVIDNQVAGVFDNMDKNVQQSIPITGGVNAPEVQWIYDRLKKEKP
jgi:hypothetical protein